MRNRPGAIGPGGLRRRLCKVALGVGLVMSVVVVSLEATSFRDKAAAGTPRGPRDVALVAGSPTRQPAGLGLPTLGDSQVVERDDVADPFVLTVPAGAAGTPKASYVLYWTTDWRSNVPTAVSSDLVHWRRIADSLPNLPSWAIQSKTMTWGPTVHRVGNGWVLYYSTEDAATRLECIGRATSTSPTGPFSDTSSAPLVCQSSLGGDIDPSVITDASGASSLLWKNDGNATGAPVSIWEQRLAPDGLSLTGSPTRLIGAAQAWERGIVEGPAMLADSRGRLVALLFRGHLAVQHL